MHATMKVGCEYTKASSCGLDAVVTVAVVRRAEHAGRCVNSSELYIISSAFICHHSHKELLLVVFI